MVFRPAATGPSYVGNFSVELALAALSATGLDPGIRRRLATRMSDYPETLNKNIFVAQLAAVLTTESPARRAVLPLIRTLAGGFLDVQRLLDPVFTWVGFKQSLVHSHVNFPSARPESIDWDEALDRSSREYRKLSGDNPYGFRDTLWKKIERRPKAYFSQTNDRVFAQRMRTSREWEDYDLMLAVLHEYGARALVISVPVNAKYLRALGTTPKAWEDYYGMVHKVARSYRIPVVDFKNHEDDPEFFGFADPNPKGWVYINRATDAFFHGRLPSIRGIL